MCGNPVLRWVVTHGFQAAWAQSSTPQALFALLVGVVCGGWSGRGGSGRGVLRHISLWRQDKGTFRIRSKRLKSPSRTATVPLEGSDSWKVARLSRSPRRVA